MVRATKTDRLPEIKQQWLDVPTDKVSAYAWAALEDIEWLIEALERRRAVVAHLRALIEKHNDECRECPVIDPW